MVYSPAEYEPAPGESFYVDIYITTDVPLTAWSLELDDGGGVYSIAPSEPGLYGSDISNYRPRDWIPPLPPPEDPGWSENGTPWSGGPLDAVQMGNIAENPGLGAVSGFAVWVELTAPNDPAQLPAIVTGLNAVVGDLSFQPITPTVLPLVLTPEPSTIGLLCAGSLVLLRRRR